MPTPVSPPLPAILCRSATIPPDCGNVNQLNGRAFYATLPGLSGLSPRIPPIANHHRQQWPFKWLDSLLRPKSRGKLTCASQGPAQGVAVGPLACSSRAPNTTSAEEAPGSPPLSPTRDASRSGVPLTPQGWPGKPCCGCPWPGVRTTAHTIGPISPVSQVGNPSWACASMASSGSAGWVAPAASHTRVSWCRRTLHLPPPRASSRGHGGAAKMKASSVPSHRVFHTL